MFQRFYFLLVIVCLLANVFKLHAQSPSFRTYINPVIPGDHADATLTRVGKDFYTTGSSFNPTPIIYHSTDLVHWEAIAQPVSASWTNYGNTPGGGAWGGHIVYFNGKFWHFFSRSNTMYFVTANVPEGPWSAPVKINNPASLPYGLGYDNSIFIDDDGKWYLVVKNGQPNNGIVELGANGQPTGTVYNLNWLNPSPYPYSWAEGPVMWKAFGWYYYSFARDLSGGQKVMRSRVLTADQVSWEMLGDLFNQNDPLKTGALFTEPNHASPVVMLDDSTSWLIHPLYAKGEWKGQGRQGLLNQVRYNSISKPTADYPVNKTYTAPRLHGSGIPWMVPKSDFFNESKLNPEWSFLGYTQNTTWSLTEKPGWLRLSPKTSTIGNTIVKNDGEHGYSLITHLDFDAVSTADEAGLRIIRGDETKKVKLYSGFNNAGQKIIGFGFDSYLYTAANTIGNDLWLKMVRHNHMIFGYYSNDGVIWIQTGPGINISTIDSYSDFTSFTGTRQGIYVQHKPALFDLYIYRDAYTPILSTSFANQFGVKQVSAEITDSIHPNDWILYAGVEFGNDDYAKRADSVLITTAGLVNGIAEIWLDSIETGIKSGECEIKPTGSLTTYGISRAAISKVTGRHDVYIRFNGSAYIGRFKTLQFIAETAPHFVLAETENHNVIKVKLDKKIILAGWPSGIRVENNGIEYLIDSLVINQADSSQFRLYLHDSVEFGHYPVISYDTGLIQSKKGMELVSFRKPVTNTLPDPYPAPQLIDAKTTFNGTEWNTISLYFDMELAEISSQEEYFEISVNDTLSSIASVYGNKDSLWLATDAPMKFGDVIRISYSGGQIKGINNTPVAAFSDVPVENIIPLETGLHFNEDINRVNSIYFGNGKTGIYSDKGFKSLQVYDYAGKLIVMERTPSIRYATIITLDPGLYIVKVNGLENFSAFKISVR